MNYFPVHPQIILFPSILKPLGSLSYKVYSVQQAGEYASFPKVPTVPSGQESLPEIPDSQLRRFTLVFSPKNALSSVPRAPLGSRDGEYAPMCCERATSIIRTLLWFLLDEDEIAHIETALSIIIISSKPEVCPAQGTVLHLLLLLCPRFWLCSSFLKGRGPSQPFDLRRSPDTQAHRTPAALEPRGPRSLLFCCILAPGLGCGAFETGPRGPCRRVLQPGFVYGKTLATEWV